MSTLDKDSTQENPDFAIAAPSEASMKKPVELVVMKPAAGVSVTRAARLIYNSLIAHSQTEITRLDSPPLSTETFRIHFSSALKTVGLESSNFNVCKKYVEELEDWKVVWESPNKDGQQSREQIRMLSQSKLVKQDKQVFLDFAFPPYVNKLLWEASKKHEYALILLRVMSSLGYTALCLYEICAKFRGIPQTPRKPPAWWQDAVAQRGLAPDEKRREWRKFKSEKLKPAVDEINELTDLKITLIEHKVGRVVTEVQFEIKRQKLKTETTQTPPDASLIELAVVAGINEKNALSLIKQYGEEKFRIGLATLNAYKGSTPLKSKYAYLKRCLYNNEELPTQNKLFDKTPEDVEHKEVAPLQPVEIGNIQTKHEDGLRRQFLENLRSEPEAERRRFLLMAERALTENGLKIGQTEKSRIEEAKVTAGIVGSKALEIYCVEKHGPDWKNTPQYILVKQAAPSQGELIEQP